MKTRIIAVLPTDDKKVKMSTLDFFALKKNELWAVYEYCNVSI